MTVSESTAFDLRSFGIRKIQIVKNGVNLISPLPKPEKPKNLTLIFLSALAKDKGPEDAIKAFSEIHSQIPSATLWVVGKGSPVYVSSLKTLAANLPVTFTGYISQKEKFRLLSISHLLLNTSFHEGWGLVNIEANSVGTPVVGFDSSGIRDSVKNGQTGVLVSRGDFHQLAKQVIELWNNPSFYKSLSVACQKWAQEFSWEKAARDSLKLVKSI